MFYLRDAVESGNSRHVDNQNGLSNVESHYDEDCCDYGSISSKVPEIDIFVVPRHSESLGFIAG
jgi:hypothetical protein